jgi:NAD-dependent dihydropyrimidine dehydrogenase PreA subunit
MAHVITEPCIDVMDLACIEECPVDCIYQGESMSYVHPAECVDCGACEPVCPVEAIFYEDDVPQEQRRFIEIGQDFSMVVEGGGARNKRYSYDSPLISDSASRPTATAVRGGDGSFLSNPPGMSIAAAWASSGITASGLKMLLLFFDKVR